MCFYYAYAYACKHHEHVLQQFCRPAHMVQNVCGERVIALTLYMYPDEFCPECLHWVPERCVPPPRWAERRARAQTLQAQVERELREAGDLEHKMHIRLERGEDTTNAMAAMAEGQQQQLTRPPTPMPPARGLPGGGSEHSESQGADRRGAQDSPATSEDRHVSSPAEESTSGAEWSSDEDSTSEEDDPRLGEDSLAMEHPHQQWGRPGYVKATAAYGGQEAAVVAAPDQSFPEKPTEWIEQKAAHTQEENHGQQETEQDGEIKVEGTIRGKKLRRDGGPTFLW